MKSPNFPPNDSFEERLGYFDCPLRNAVIYVNNSPDKDLSHPDLFVELDKPHGGIFKKKFSTPLTGKLVQVNYY